jgi:hypothetical protein
VKRARLRIILLAVLIAAAVSAVLVHLVYKPWALNWGASTEETSRSMPGDNIVSNPTFNATRAVTIDATPEEIWPWIIQMGYRRAGFYSYDRLDNDGIPSADRLISKFQRLEVGDSIPLTSHEYVKVISIDPCHSMVWKYKSDDTSTIFTWTWGLYRQNDSQTRLLTRLRYRVSDLHSRLMLEFFEIVMMRKCMLGIKQRAESQDA